MRFDGYFILMDYLGMDNLQPRAFALGRWQLRELLLGIGDAPPEEFSPSRRRILITYAWATWIYRLLLFVGIALLVYHFMFKLAGVVLMLAELVWLVAIPIARELQTWWNRRSGLRWNIHTVTTLLACFGIGFLLFAPWQEQIRIPALVSAQNYLLLYPPTASRLTEVAVQSGQQVVKGQLLLNLESPDLEQKLTNLDNRIAALQWQIEHAVSRQMLLENTSVMATEMAALLVEKKGLLARMEKLRITAPFDGVVRQLEKSLHRGRWLAADMPLLELIDQKDQQIHGFIGESDIKRLIPGATGSFRPNAGAMREFAVQLTSVAAMPVDYLKKPYLASIYGGPIQVWEESPGRLAPTTATYRLPFAINGAKLEVDHELPGTIKLNVHGESIWQGIRRQVGQVVIRESGF